ncbi:c-type cytochrome [Roseomonas sp. E05]|uniref:c-type cytochrome n=1 Tax=Roseomonas sp. E05 TaxID=3046310 RepID=UPI0024B87E78|nr:c-type cytochrome [Roseomonas sp. E05]MDJ0388101.1 c-type cytochrome [Roseomonas sp. E05]
MTIRLTFRRAALGVAALLLGGLLFAWSGVMTIGASSGHWPVTEWFLHWVMRSSVRTHALSVKAPEDLSSPALLARGAGHYATGCAPCHGAPGQPQNPVMQQSLPSPPPLAREPGDWTPEERFRIVQHGVRYSGMPAWVAPERTDEVWAMVAFLQAMPQMSPETYRRLAYGPEQGEEAQAHGAAGLRGLAREEMADCARCHGPDGRGRDNAAFPVLSGQSETYLAQALTAFAEGKRHSGIMQPPAARTDAAALREIAAHYARQPAFPVPQSADAALLAEGERIARAGIPEEGVPACLSCHGGAALARNPAYPRLHGQHAGYLETQLALWREGKRGGGPFSVLMHTIAERLEPDQAKAAAAWFATRREAPDQ